MTDNKDNYRETGLSKEECQKRVDAVIEIYKFRNPDKDVPASLMNWVENIASEKELRSPLTMPEVGECWKDGKEYITITDVHCGDLARDVWVKYRFDSGVEEEKNWIAFHSRFQRKAMEVSGALITKINVPKIEKALGVKSEGKIKAGSGYFGVLETAANRPKQKRIRKCDKL